MKINLKRYAISIIFPLAIVHHTSFAKQSSINYQNERGSALQLTFHANHSISGSFITAVASKDCQHVIGQKRPVQGYIVGKAITFIVSYPSCGSVLSLTGHISQEKDTIDTFAIIAKQMSSFKDGPGTEFITHDKFNKVKSS